MTPTLIFPSIITSAGQNILPFILLPLLLLLAFLCPPFRWRGVIFAFLIILTNYACIISEWPPNSGPSRPMRYGMTGSWIFVLPAVERLLMYTPENDIWRLGKAEALKKGQNCHRSVEKLRWACDLVSTPRAVGWSIGSRQLNATLNKSRPLGETRRSFLMSKVIRAALAYLAIDSVVYLGSKTGIPLRWAWDIPTLINIMFVEGLMAASVYSTMTLQFEIAALISVGLKFSDPMDWPPLFGSISQCYSIANVWGKFWHGYIRQPVLGFSRFIISQLGILPKSLVAYLVHLTTAFFISGFFHSLSLLVVAEGRIDTTELVLDMVYFFMSQPIATILETSVTTYWNSSSWISAEGTGLFRLFPSLVMSNSMQYTIGYTWVACWFIFTGWWFVQPYIAIGVLEWPLPFSIWKMLCE